MNDTNEKHIHHDLIVAWAKGAKIQYYEGGRWWDILAPMWKTYYEYRVKPTLVKPTPPEYPKTRLDGGQLYNIYRAKDGNVFDSLVATVNKSIEELLKTNDVGMYYTKLAIYEKELAAYNIAVGVDDAPF